MKEESMQLSWDSYLATCYRLADAVEKELRHAVAVHGFQADGLIPAVIVAKQMGAEILDGVRTLAQLTHGNTSNVIVVAGYFSGGVDVLSLQSAGCKLAALYYAPGLNGQIKPDIWIHEVQEKPHYPYDPEYKAGTYSTRPASNKSVKDRAERIKQIERSG